MNADLTKKHEKISQVRDINGLSFGIYKPLSTGISRSIGPCYIQITVKFVTQYLIKSILCHLSCTQPSK